MRTWVLMGILAAFLLIPGALGQECLTFEEEAAIRNLSNSSFGNETLLVGIFNSICSRSYDKGYIDSYLNLTQEYIDLKLKSTENATDAIKENITAYLDAKIGEYENQTDILALLNKSIEQDKVIWEAVNQTLNFQQTKAELTELFDSKMQDFKELHPERDEVQGMITAYDESKPKGLDATQLAIIVAVILGIAGYVWYSTGKKKERQKYLSDAERDAMAGRQRRIMSPYERQSYGQAYSEAEELKADEEIRKEKSRAAAERREKARNAIKKDLEERKARK